MSKLLQHTVSRFYLKGFTPAIGDKVLWEYGKREPNPRRVSPKIATTHSRIYSVQRADGSWDDCLEDGLQKVETMVAGALRSLGAGEAPNDDDRITISFFIGLMFYRVYGRQVHAHLQAEKMARPEETIRFIQTRRDKLLTSYSEEAIATFEDEVRRRGRGVKMPSKFHLRGIADRAKLLALSIASMRWTVEQACKDSFFITSDNPMFVRRPRRIFDAYLVGVNRDDLDAELGFPLSRQAFLLCRWKGEPFEVRRVKTARVLCLNERTVLSAHEFVFAPERSRHITELVTKHAGFQLRYPLLDS